MTYVAASLNPVPFFVRIGALPMPRKVYQQPPRAAVTTAGAVTGAPNDDEHPSDRTTSTENYHAYLPLFVP